MFRRAESVVPKSSISYGVYKRMKYNFEHYIIQYRTSGTDKSIKASAVKNQRGDKNHV